MRRTCLPTYVLAVLTSTILVSPAAAADDVILYALDATAINGSWRKETGEKAAGGVRLRHPDAGRPKQVDPLASPAHYFEMTFTADAGVPYRLWIRGRGDGNHWANDSVFVQFDDSVDSSGRAVWRIGTSSATTVNIEDCSNCGLAWWGWQDNGWGVGVLGPLVRFETTGTHRLRVQTREDGISLDQIVLSPSTYLTSAPGALKNDTTILPKSGSGDPSGGAGITLEHGPFLQQVKSGSAKVVWATREAGASEVRYSSNGTSFIIGANTTRYPASRTGFSYDYYQHVATLPSLTTATTYTYDVFTGGVDATPGRTFTLKTAPAPGATTPVRFVVFGDSGVGSTAQQQVASRIAADRFDFALHAGDLTYGASSGIGDGTYRTLTNWFFNVYGGWLHSRPIWPSMGNHDSRSSTNWGRHYLDMFVLPSNERYYTFAYGQVQVFVLDTEYAFQDATRRQAQLAWLDKALAAANRPWKVAVFHRPPFSSGSGHGSDLAVRQAFAPLFERHGVDVVFTAHDHIYERTKPQQTTANGSPVTYIVTGGGGAPLYTAGSSSFTAFSAARHHYVRATATDCTLTLEAVDSNGSVFDASSIARC